MADLEDLVVPQTKEEIEQRMLDLAEEQDLPTSNWTLLAWIRTILLIFAEVFADVWYSIAQISNGAVLELATGRWLDRIAGSQYDDARKDPVFNVGTLLLADGGVGHSIPVGSVVVESGGLKYVNTTGGALAAGGTLELTFRGEAVGAKYNLPNGSTWSLVTSLPTVTVTNPAIGSTGTWITTLGADPETDAGLRTRLKAKWGTLSTGSPVSAYEYWALSTTGVTRRWVDDGNPDGPGTLRVYIDAASSVATLQTTLDAKRPAGTKATAWAASVQAVAVPGVVYVQRAYRATAEAAIARNLVTLAAEIDIGAEIIQSEVIERVMRPDGVTDFQLGSSWVGTPNIQLAPGTYPQFTNELTIVEI